MAKVTLCVLAYYWGTNEISERQHRIGSSRDFKGSPTRFPENGTRGGDMNWREGAWRLWLTGAVLLGLYCASLTTFVIFLPSGFSDLTDENGLAMANRARAGLWSGVVSMIVCFLHGADLLAEAEERKTKLARPFDALLAYWRLSASALLATGYSAGFFSYVGGWKSEFFELTSSHFLVAALLTWLFCWLLSMAPVPPALFARWLWSGFNQPSSGQSSGLAADTDRTVVSCTKCKARCKVPLGAHIHVTCPKCGCVFEART